MARTPKFRACGAARGRLIESEIESKCLLQVTSRKSAEMACGAY